MEITQAIIELQKIAKTLTAAVAKLQGNGPAITDADMTRACHGMTARHALLLEVLMTDPNTSNRKAGKLAGMAETTTRRLRAKWAKQFPGIANTLMDREENLRLLTGRAERQYTE